MNTNTVSDHLKSKGYEEPTTYGYTPSNPYSAYNEGSGEVYVSKPGAGVYAVSDVQVQPEATQTCPTCKNDAVEKDKINFYCKNNHKWKIN